MRKLHFGGLFNSLMNHPVTRLDRAAAVRRFLRWQAGSRILGQPILMPWVKGTRLLVARGWAGATGNLYTGLLEFQDMAFTLHFLRPGDLFTDIGANIGVYTVLAAGAAGADAISVEPVPATYRRLVDNVNINGLAGRVVAKNAGLADAPGKLAFTVTSDAMNHVATGDDTGPVVEVDVLTADAMLGPRVPAMIKLDVEGYEFAVLSGAKATLASPELKAIIIELNGSGRRYDIDDETLHALLVGYGFACCAYDPKTRELQDAERPTNGNGIYVRDREFVAGRLKVAAPFEIFGQIY